MTLATETVTDESIDTQNVTNVVPRHAVLAMPEYHPPLAGRDSLRLDFNENTFAASPKVIERMRAITAEGLTKYPEREGVEKIVAAHFGVDADQVLLTNGVDEAIHLVCVAFLEEGDEALICTPTFFMYDVSVSMMTSGLKKVQADASLEFPYAKFLAAITPKTKLIIVASPNNPTGAVVSREHLLAICAAAPHAVVMVDEAYYHFHGESLFGDVDSVPNLIVARTFSKAYGLAFLRIGMLVGNAGLMRYVRKVSSPYNVNGVALDCLPVALADDAYVQWYAEQVHAGRRLLPEPCELCADEDWSKAQGAGCGNARAGRAAARSVERSGMRGICADHGWHRRACHEGIRGVEGIFGRNQVNPCAGAVTSALRAVLGFA
jgi:histidinol-phosphate aminotransferase